MPQNMKTTKYGEGKVYWAADQSPEQYTFYRVGTSGETTRSIDEIPPEELTNAMYEILIDFSSCEKDSLYRETVKRFGFAVVTAKARKFLDLGLSVLKSSGKI